MNAIAEISEARTLAVLARLTSTNPAVIDINLHQSLTRLLGQRVSVETERRYPEDGRYVSVPVRATVAGSFSTQTLEQARRMVEDAMTPLPDADLARELSRLALTTAHRAKGDVDMQLLAAAYIDLMRGYPADVALAVLRKPRQWWPTAYELSSDADALVAERRVMLNLMVVTAPTRGEAAVRALMSRPQGPRKLPDGWREAAGIKPSSGPAVPDEGPWEPDMTPVTVSASLKAILAGNGQTE